MAELFEMTKQNISLHIKNIFDEGELDRKLVVNYSLTTATDGKKYSVEHYSLDVIISELPTLSFPLDVWEDIKKVLSPRGSFGIHTIAKIQVIIRSRI